jgi:Holliday junction DNA helicase RuvA
MIGRLAGTLALKQVEAVLVEVGGVGYEVHCPLTVLETLPPEGGACVLWIHTHVREDQIALFGFGTPDERALFRLLIAVTGIGPKLAVACLSGLKAEAFARAVVDGDVKKLSGIPGVGKRTAERLVLELQATNSRALTLGGAAAPAPADRAHLDDLQSALCNLGYRAKDVEGPSSRSSLGGERGDELSRGCCGRRSSA